MKKTIVFICLVMGLGLKTSAQIETWKTGLIAGVTATNNFSGSAVPFQKNFNLFAVTSLTTKKMLFSCLYSFGENAIGTLDGVSLGKEWDTYIVGFKNLSESNGYLGAGIEKLFLVNEDIKIFPFAEIGTDFKFKQKLLTIGVLLNVQGVIYKRGK